MSTESQGPGVDLSTPQGELSTHIRLDRPASAREVFLVAGRLSSSKPPIMTDEEAREWLTASPPRRLTISTADAEKLEDLLEESGLPARFEWPQGDSHRECESESAVPMAAPIVSLSVLRVLLAPAVLGALLVIFSLLQLSSVDWRFPSDASRDQLSQLTSLARALDGIHVLTWLLASLWTAGLTRRCIRFPDHRPQFGPIGAFFGVAVPFFNLLGLPVVLKGLWASARGDTHREGDRIRATWLTFLAWFCLLVSVGLGPGRSAILEILEGGRAMGLHLSAWFVFFRLALILLSATSLYFIDRLLRDRAGRFIGRSGSTHAPTLDAPRASTREASPCSKQLYDEGQDEVTAPPMPSLGAWSFVSVGAKLDPRDGYRASALSFVGMFVLGLVLAMLAGAFVNLGLSWLADLVIQLLPLASGAAIVATTSYFLDKRQVQLSDLLRTTRPSRKLAVPAILGGIAIGLIGVSWTVRAFLALREIPWVDGLFSVFETTEMQFDLPTILALVLIAPVVEEILFRGIVLQSLRQGMSDESAVLVSAALFGLVHLHPFQALNAALLGVVFGAAAIRSNNLWIPVGLHFGNNLVVVLAGLHNPEAPLHAAFGGLGIAGILVWCWKRELTSAQRLRAGDLAARSTDAARSLVLKGLPTKKPGSLALVSTYRKRILAVLAAIQITEALRGGFLFLRAPSAGLAPARFGQFLLHLFLAWGIAKGRGIALVGAILVVLFEVGGSVFGFLPGGGLTPALAYIALGVMLRRQNPPRSSLPAIPAPVELQARPTSPLRN